MTDSTPSTPSPAGMHLLSHATEAQPATPDLTINAVLESLGGPLAPSQPKLSEQIPRRYHDDEWNTAREAEGLASVDAGRIPLSAHGIGVYLGTPGRYNILGDSLSTPVVITAGGVRISVMIDVDRMDELGIDENMEWKEIIPLAIKEEFRWHYGDKERIAIRAKLDEWIGRPDDDWEFRNDAIDDAEVRHRARLIAERIGNPDIARLVIASLTERFPESAK